MSIQRKATGEREMVDIEKADTYCTQCGKSYDLWTSNASCDYLFCCKECEAAYEPNAPSQ